MIICIEGIDASGKATQSRRLAQHLSAQAISFPDYDTPTGHLIRGHLKCYWSALPDRPSLAESDFRLVDTALLNALVFQALQLANRMEHASAIACAVATGRHLVLDRYWPSGWAYGSADGLDDAWLLQIHEHLPQPDLFVLLDVPPEKSSERRPVRRDRLEAQEGLMERVGVLYRQLWRRMAEEHGRLRWAVVDGIGTELEVEGRIWQCVERLLRG
jgi:thymidylate kinase